MYVNDSTAPDSEWVLRSLFSRTINAGRGGSDVLNRNMKYTAGYLNYADHAVGGNKFINAKPGFTPYADLDLETLLVNSKMTAGKENSTGAAYLGMGRYYSEAIDANQRYVYMTMGVPKHNSMANFFTTYYDMGHGKMANTGKVSDSMFNTIGKCLTQMFLLTTFPVYSILAVLAGTTTKMLYDARGIPMSKYYYLMPTMPLYWTTVGIIVNQIAVNMEMAQSAEMKVSKNKTPAEEDGKVVNGVKSGEEDSINEAFNRMLPGILRNDTGGLDVRRISQRYTAMQSRAREIMDNIRENNDDDASLEAAVKEYINNQISGITPISKFEDYIKEYTASASGKGTHSRDDLPEGVTVSSSDSASTDTTDANTSATIQDQQNLQQQAEIAASADGGADSEDINGKPWYTGVWNFLTDFSTFTMDELRQGSAYVAFAVDHEPTITESVSSTTKQSEIAAKMNQTSSDSRTRLFNLSGGNISDGAIGSMVNAGMSAIGELIGGGLQAVGFSGLAQLGGRANVDIPEYWDETTTTFPTMSYTIHLRAPYGHPISILTNIIIPLACLIATAFPRATGKSSFTGPFLVKWWDKGRSQGQLGIVDSMTIQRGTGSVGWNLAQQATGVDVTLSIKTLSKTTSVPICADISVSDIVGMGMFDEDTPFTEYMAILAGMGMENQVHAVKRWALRRARFWQKVEDYWEPEHLAQRVADTTLGTLAAFVLQTRNRWVGGAQL